MSNSTLATLRFPVHPNNYYGERGCKIDRIIIHHMAGVSTAEACARTFQNPSRGASANYCIGKNGEIAVSVDEEYAAGASSNKDADLHGVSIEVSNDKTGGQWTVSDASLSSLIKLVADIAKRNGIKLVKGKSVVWHQMYAATACPGPYLLSKMDYIIDEANKLLNSSEGYLSGVNKTRTTDTLIMYTGKKSTGTNRYGTEVLLDKNGIVLSVEVGKGNAEIPKDGKVLSGHGINSKWLQTMIKPGYLVWSEDGKIQVSQRQHRTVDAINDIRHAEQLVVYNKGVANTNPYGREVAVSGGKATSDPVYGKGRMTVPAGGFVLSGHGKASEWMKDAIRKGDVVEYNGKYITVTR